MATDSPSPSVAKDIFLQHVFTDIKEIHEAQCNISTHMDILTDNDRNAQLLCDHLDHILMHGLYRSADGYWPCVSYYTHKMIVEDIKNLINVNTNIGRGRAWLNIALNEQALESYLRMFCDNQHHMKLYYAKEAFLRDVERLSLLLTVISGLDFVSFNLPNDESYLNMSASPSVSNSGVDFSVKPKFIGSVTPVTVRKKGLSSSGGSASPISSSPVHALRSMITSSLPTHVMMTNSSPPNDTKDDITESQDAQYSPLVQSTPSESAPSEPPVIPKPTFSESTPLESEPVLSLSEDRSGSLPSPGQEDMQSQSTAQPLSFLDRYSQLADQEEEKTNEIVSRKKKSTKGKKKKKKKDSDSRVKKPTKKEPLEKTIHQATDESVKENQAPLLSDPTTAVTKTNDIVTPSTTDTTSMMDNNQSKEKTNNSPTIHVVVQDEPSKIVATESVENSLDHSNVQPMSLEESVDNTVVTSLNPFGNNDGDDDNTDSIMKENTPAQLSRKTSNEYQFGNVESTENVDSEFYTLLDRAATSVHTRRHSPKPPSTQIEPAITPNIEEDERQPLDEQQTANEEDSATVQDKDLSILDSSTISFNNPPKRPMEITDTEKTSCDVPLDDNTRIVLSLDVFYQSNETAVRLVQAYVPQGPGRYQRVCVVITNSAVYVTQYDGTEGVFSHMTGVPFSQLSLILIGLGWQSFTLVYDETVNDIKKKNQQIIITGSEAVSRSIIDSIRSVAETHHTKTIQLKHDDELRTEAIEKELIQLGSETSMEIVKYCMVYWEQLSGEPPLLSPPADISVPISGTLFVKEVSMFMIQSWNVGYFQLIDGVLYHFNNETDKTPKSSYPLRGLKCGGCTRAAGETKENSFKVLDSNGSSLVLAAEDEEDMTRWMQALCLATIGEKSAAIKSPIQKGGAYCAVLLTQNKIHIIKEDWANETVQIVTSISVQDVNEVCVENSLPVYCTLRYDDWENESQGTWMLCFSSEYELGQFERCLFKKYKEIFQVDLGYAELTDSTILTRAHQAIELMQASKNRSDSITRGRTVFTFDQS